MDGIELKLLAGLPIHVDGIGDVYAPTLNEIARIGESKYNQYLSIILLDRSKASLFFENIDVDELTDYDFLALVAHYYGDIREELLKAFQMVLKNKVNFDFNGQDMLFSLDKVNSINRTNFDNLKKVIGLQNSLEKIEDDKDNPANDKAREILEKRKKARQKVNKAKSGGEDEESLTLFDLISILAGSSRNYNLINHENNPMNVWNLTMFQFNDAFNRLRMFKDYDVNIQAILHGAKPEDVELKHWISKIQN